MAHIHDTLYECNDLYQQGTGASWENLVYARTGDGKGSYVYPKGKNDKTQYKPKDLCYIYKYDLDATTFKLYSVYYTIVFRYYNTQKFNYPKIRVYTGKKGNNTFIKEITTYEKIANNLENDKHTIQYKITGLTINQLKSLIVKVVWDKNKTNESAKISINRARLSINYDPLEPNYSVYSNPTLATCYLDDEFIWSLTMKNTGDCGRGSTSIYVPRGARILGSSSNSSKDSYDSMVDIWEANLCKGESVTRNFRIKFDYVGQFDLRAFWNGGAKCLVNVEQYYPSPSNELITITPYQTFAYENGYFDIGIYGVYNGETVHCYDIELPQGLNIDYPLRDCMIDLGQNNNINRFIHSDDPEVVITDDNRICLIVNDPMANFEAHIRIPFFATPTGDYPVTVTSLDSHKDYDSVITIIEPRGLSMQVASAISRDRRYVYNSMNIGSPHIWSVRAKASRYNFFDEMDDTLSVDIEPMIAFIGVIPLSRCHKASVTAESKNTLIENRYLNRAYYGKKGDYSESIKMTLRMAWYDVATLQGLCEMDKPIPIDTIPERPDGDPLNHRGWAELTGVTNIKKINDRLYECDVEVTYLTHKILTKFGITEGAKITANAISYYLDLVHDYTDNILDLLTPSYYQFFTNLEDVTGNNVGSWEIEAMSDLTLYNTNKVNTYSTWDINFRNHLPSLMSEDFDGNWEMALRLKNAKTGNLLFEHMYTNFKHYDFDSNRAVNSADVTTTVWNNNAYETLNFDKVGLGYDYLAPLVEDRKTPTHFNTMENMVIEGSGEEFEIFLLDSDNKGIANQVVRVDLSSSDGFRRKFNVMTDVYGRVLFDPTYGNSDFTVTLTFDETKDYRSCNYTTMMNVNLDYEETHFTYQEAPIVLNSWYYYECTLLDSENNPVPTAIVYYSFRTMTGDYGHEESTLTDNNGVARIPITFFDGTNMMKVNMKGFTENNVVYQPTQFETEVKINIDWSN